VVFEAELCGGMGEIHSVGRFPKPLAIGRVDSQWEESKNSAAVIVDHDKRHGFVAEQRKGIQIMKNGEVAEQGNNGFARSRGNAGDGGDVAVDAAGASVSEDLDGTRRSGFRAGIEIADGHGISEEEKRGAGGNGTGDGGLGELVG
jgi:hypothetical protein